MEFSKNPMIAWMRKAYEYVLQYKKEFLLGAVFFVGLIVLLVGYSFYKSSLQKKAHTDFVAALKIYDAPVHEKDLKDDKIDLAGEFFTSEEEKWLRVASVFEKGYQNNKGAGIAPMFLAYQADALINLGKFSEARDALKNAVGLMKDSATKSAFKVKLALLNIDNGNKEEGVSILKEMALDSKDPVHDMVLYRLGEYYWFAKNFDEVRNYWNQLVLKYGKGVQKPSWWADQATQKLELISVE
jgi:predicted negative regulator of RcsB-dependent stress response